MTNPGQRKQDGLNAYDNITRFSTDLPHAVDLTTLYHEIKLCVIRKEKAMRVIHVTNSARKGTAGIEKAATSLAMTQKARGYDVMLAIDSEGPFTAECQNHGISVMVHEGLGQPLDGSTSIVSAEAAILDFIECIKSFNPDIIHCHFANSALVGIAAGNRMGIPCAFTSDGTRWVIEGLRRGLRFAAICLTAESFEELKRETIDMGLFRIPNGTRIAQAQARKPEDDYSASLILAGSLVPQKGIDIAIIAMVELRRRLGQDCPVLNIYGGGFQEKYLTEMATVLELNDVVRFHGFKSGILEHCSNADILVVPSRWEAGPLVVLEAMSRGMPVVSSDVGEVSEMLPDRRYGRVIPLDSITALADAIESLLTDIADGKFDPDLLIERHRSLYSTEKWAERIEAAYDQILLNNSASSQQAR